MQFNRGEIPILLMSPELALGRAREPLMIAARSTARKPMAAKGRLEAVFLDEAHHNFHTATGRYKPFADLIGSDGYQVTPNKQTFSKETLKGCDVLVISNALGAAAMGSPEASNPAFTEDECDAVRDWVRAGGNLLLIADHTPTWRSR